MKFSDQVYGQSVYRQLGFRVDLETVQCKINAQFDYQVFVKLMCPQAYHVNRKYVVLFLLVCSLLFVVLYGDSLLRIQIIFSFLFYCTDRFTEV